MRSRLLLAKSDDLPTLSKYLHLPPMANLLSRCPSSHRPCRLPSLLNVNPVDDPLVTIKP